MKRTKPTQAKLSTQLERRHRNGIPIPEQKEYEGHGGVVSTGSTLLDLAISGGRFQAGGIPAGILVEVFGPSGAGKTVLLCQLAGNVQRAGGEVMFHDPEARLNKQFAKMFGLDPSTIGYTIPDTIPEVFRSVREWLPEKAEATAPLYGVFADSLAALSTALELGKDEGDKMGMRRAKEFSEELRKTCRIITQRDALVVCSNQVRQNLDAGPYGQRYKSPGGEAIGFYSSLRLRCMSPRKLQVKRTFRGQEHSRVVGVRVEVEVFKSSIWKPFHVAEVFILYDYGIDDIRANLSFLKTNTGAAAYKIGGNELGRSLDRAIQVVEAEGLEDTLRGQVIELWREIESKFAEERKPRR